MKYLKTYENWFTNLFKSKDYNETELFMQSLLTDLDGETTLMHCANDGDIKKFKNYFNEYTPNEIDKYGETTLMKVVKGKGSFNDKKEMIKMLIDNGEDPFKINMDGKTFLDFIKDKNLRQWVLKTFPDIDFQVDLKKYNL